MSSKPLSPRPSLRALFCAGTGLALLLLSLVPVLGLTRGSAGARCAVFLLLAAIAAGAAVPPALRRFPAGWLLTALLPIGLAFFLRALLLDYVTPDYETFLSQWAQAFRENGGFAAVRLPIGNYNAPYLYFLAAISYLPVPDLYLIKLFSILFDVVLAWGGLRLVRRFCPPDSIRPLVCFCLLLLLPTVVLNGSCWGQCDSLYGALTLHALACALEQRPKSSLALLGVAFSFKLQTVFLLPLWGALWLMGRLKFRHLFCFPAAYGVTILPALLLGKPLGDILGVYLGQTREGVGSLCYNAATVFSFLPYDAQVNETLGAKLGIAAALLLALTLLALLRRRRKTADETALLAAAAVMAIGVPFLLPYMHDRYFFLADVLTLAWACALPRRWYCAVLVQLSSLSAYAVYLRQRYTLILSLGGRTYVMLAEALLMLAALILALLALFARLRPVAGSSAR